MAIEAIESFSAGKALEDFKRDLMFRSAVERQFEIIGEAVRRLGVEDPSIFARFPQGREMIDLRNIISHNYDGVDLGTVWSIKLEDLPNLKALVHGLITQISVSS